MAVPTKANVEDKTSAVPSPPTMVSVIIRLVAAMKESLPAPPLTLTFPVALLKVNESAPAPPTRVAASTTPNVTVKAPAVLAAAVTLVTVVGRSAVMVRAWSPVTVRVVAVEPVMFVSVLAPVAAFKVSSSMPATLSPPVMVLTFTVSESEEPVTPV